MSDQLVAVLGRGVLESDEPFIYADDLGLTRGDGCFDATLIFSLHERAGSADTSDAADGADAPRRDAQARKILHLDRHLARLARSAAALDLECPPAGDWTDLVRRAVIHRGAPAKESMLKLVLERGREDHGGGPVGYLTMTALPDAMIAERAGIAVASMSRGHASDAYADVPWLLGGVKTIAYAINMAAKREAARRGAHDALFVATDGYVLEAPTAALILRTGDDLVTTPIGATGVLASITVETLFEAAAAQGMRVEHRLMRPAEVYEADGAWLVSSVRGIAPVRTLDDREVAFDRHWHERITALAGFEPPPAE